MISREPPIDQTHPEARGQERSGDMVYGAEPPKEQSRAKKGEVWIWTDKQNYGHSILTWFYLGKDELDGGKSI